MTNTSSSPPSRLKILQQRISIAAWSFTLLLSLRGLFVFYGMKEKGSIEQIVTFITDPIVQLFQFNQIENIGIPGISVLFATISILLFSQFIQFSIWLTQLRFGRARAFVYQHAMRSNKQT